MENQAQLDLFEIKTVHFTMKTYCNILPSTETRPFMLAYSELFNCKVVVGAIKTYKT